MINYLGSDTASKVEASSSSETGRNPEYPESSEYPKSEYPGYPEYRVPENRLYRPRPPHPAQAYNSPGPQRGRGPPPRLEYFGPKDFKPESAFLIPQSKIRPTMLNVQGRPGSPPGPAREKLEPKPRKLFRRSPDSPDSSLQDRLGVIHLFREVESY